MLKRMMMVMMCLMITAPVMADSHDHKEETMMDTSSLSKKQKKALEAYKSEMKTFHEKKMADKKEMKSKWQEGMETRKKAFIDGDFEALEEVYEEKAEAKEDMKEDYYEARIAAMENAFGKLSNKDREALVEFVMDNKSEWKKNKMKKKYKNKKDKM